MRNAGHVTQSLHLVTHRMSVCPAGSVDFVRHQHGWGPWEAQPRPRPSLPFSASVSFGEGSGEGAPLLPGLKLRDPRSQEMSGGRNCGGGRMCSAPDLTPELRAQTRPGASMMCAGGRVLTGNSLPGLSQGPWNQVQASEAPQTSCFNPTTPWSSGGNTAGLK